MDKEPSLEFICKTLAELFEFPCDFSLPQEVLYNNDKALEWCEKYCGENKAAECWEYFFRLKFTERSKDNERRQRTISTE